MSLPDGVRSVERDTQFSELIIITFNDGSNQILEENAAHELASDIFQVLGIDWHA